VVVKGHPAHPETGALVASAIAAAVKAHGLPEGVFGHLVGPRTSWAPRWCRTRASQQWASPARASAVWR
jgi:acyl-CoA reductase-like NAD-dependent aldehyde dehydrogenase